MQTAITQFNQPIHKKTYVSQQVFSPEQKKVLGEVWTQMIIDDGKLPENMSEMNQNEIKKWLFDSMMRDIEKFSAELGLQIDAELIERIQNTKNLEEKSAFELEYIQKILVQLNTIVQGFDRSGVKSTKWDSWPERMRETKEFNCVGATLLGICLLEKGGVKSKYGNPYGHVVNIVKLSNGEWWYVDFRNNKLFKLENPRETTIAGVPTLIVKQPNLYYRIIPIYDNSEAAGSVLGNLSSLVHEAEDESIPDENIEKKEAREYLERYRKNFQNADFSLLLQLLYPKSIEFDKTEEMQEEKKWIDTLTDLEKPVQSYVMTLTNERRQALFEEIRTQKVDIDRLFNMQDESVLQNVGVELRKLLELFLESLKSLKEKQPDIYQEATDKIVGRIKNL
jgi:hypothetical protein